MATTDRNIVQVGVWVLNIRINLSLMYALLNIVFLIENGGLLVSSRLTYFSMTRHEYKLSYMHGDGIPRQSPAA